MSRTPKPRTVKKYSPKVRRYLKLQGEISERYKESDEIFDELLQRLKPHHRVPIDPTHFAQLKDNFRDKEGKPKNKAFRTHGISHYELEVKVTES
jgi:hypothetical protein